MFKKIIVSLLVLVFSVSLIAVELKSDEATAILVGMYAKDCLVEIGVQPFIATVLVTLIAWQKQVTEAGGDKSKIKESEIQFVFAGAVIEDMMNTLTSLLGDSKI